MSSKGCATLAPPRAPGTWETTETESAVHRPALRRARESWSRPVATSAPSLASWACRAMDKSANEAPPAVDREKVCPFLLRVFTKTGCHHRIVLGCHKTFWEGGGGITPKRALTSRRALTARQALLTPRRALSVCTALIPLSAHTETSAQGCAAPAVTTHCDNLGIDEYGRGTSDDCKLPTGCELQIYTWADATLREIADLIRQVRAKRECSVAPSPRR